MEYVAPTARYNRETGEIEYLNPEGEGVLGSYRDGQETVKGLVFQVTIPHQMAGKAEAYGIPIGTHVRLSAIRRVRDAIAKHEQGDKAAELPMVRSPEATFARECLGTEIQTRRKELGLSRKLLCASVRRYVEKLPGGNWHYGWSTSSIQAWETGTAAPRHIDPVIRSLAPPPDQEIRWRRWWVQCRVGVSPEERRAEIERLDKLEAEVPAEDREAVAKSRLADVLAEVNEQLDVKEAEAKAALGIDT